MSFHCRASGVRPRMWGMRRATIGLLPLVAGVPLLGGAPPSRTSNTPRPPFRVCADPNNLPFSNREGEGFENRIAALIARDLGAKVEYYWFPQRRGFVRNTLKAKRCDVVMGVPAEYEMTANTRPYYRSTYVFVSRADRALGVHSFDDPALRRLRVGVHFTGDDYDNPPAAQALARRGLQKNVVGYSIYGDYSKPNPPAALIEGVASGAVDLAVAWGPLAGYFAKRARVPLTVTAVTPAIDPPMLRFTFDIAVGVRHGDTLMLKTMQRELDRRRGEIATILREYGVPIVGDRAVSTTTTGTASSGGA